METQRDNNNTQAIKQGSILQLRDLYPQLKNFIIQGRIVIKGNRHNNSNGGQYVINLTIVDQFSELRVILKGKALERFANMLTRGYMYQFESGSVHAAKDGTVYVKLGDQARITPLSNNPAIPAMHFNPIENIACLSNIKAKSYIEIIGIIIDKQLTPKVTKRGEGMCLLLTIADNTDQVRISVWNEQAVECYKKLTEFSDDHIVMGWKYVRVAESSSGTAGQKKFLHAFRDTSIALYENDLLDLAVDVKGFKQMWINHQANNGQQQQRYGTTTTTTTTTPTTRDEEALCNKENPLHSQQHLQQVLPQDEDESDKVTTVTTTTTTTTTTTKKTTKIRHPRKKPRQEKIISLESSPSSSSSEEIEFDYKPEYCNQKNSNGKRKRLYENN